VPNFKFQYHPTSFFHRKIVSPKPEPNLIPAVHEFKQSTRMKSRYLFIHRISPPKRQSPQANASKRDNDRIVVVETSYRPSPPTQMEQYLTHNNFQAKTRDRRKGLPAAEEQASWIRGPWVSPKFKLPVDHLFAFFFRAM